MIKNELLNVLNQISQIIFDKRGENILALDIGHFSSITDCVIIAEGLVPVHVTALANSILESLEKINLYPIHVEGLQEGDWVVLDFFSFMIHLFLPELREKYQLEELWNQGKIVFLEIGPSSPQMRDNGTNTSLPGLPSGTKPRSYLKTLISCAYSK